MEHTATAAALYVRISKDDLNDGLGVERQEKACRQTAERLGWTIAEVYRENDTPSNGKPRKEYERMLADVRAGRRDAVIAWDQDRLTRQPREVEDLIELADETKISIATVNGRSDLESDGGRLVVRMSGSLAKGEVEKKSKRHRAKHEELASKGFPNGGGRRFGFGVDTGTRRVIRDGSEMVVDVDQVAASDEKVRVVWDSSKLNEPEAAVLREVYATILRDGVDVNLSQMCRDLKARGIYSSGNPPKPFSPTTLKCVLVNWANCGIREHNGTPVTEMRSKRLDPVTEEPVRAEYIIERPEFEAVLAILDDPSRKIRRGPSTGKYLMSNLMTCGRCGGVMKAKWSTKPGRTPNSKSHTWYAYGCVDCFMTVGMKGVDARMISYVAGRLVTERDALRDTQEGEPEELTRLRIAHAETSKVIEETFKDTAIPARERVRMVKQLGLELEEIERQIVSFTQSGVIASLLAGVLPPDFMDVPKKVEPLMGDVSMMSEVDWRFQELDLPKKRSVIRALCEVTIAKVEPGMKPGDRVKITELQPV